MTASYLRPNTLAISTSSQAATGIGSRRPIATEWRITRGAFRSSVIFSPRAYVVLSRGQRPDKPYGLPFFSLVSMKTATERLERAGIEVFAKEIKEASTDGDS